MMALKTADAIEMDGACGVIIGGGGGGSTAAYDVWNGNHTQPGLTVPHGERGLLLASKTCPEPR